MKTIQENKYTSLPKENLDVTYKTVKINKLV